MGPAPPSGCGAIDRRVYEQYGWTADKEGICASSGSACLADSDEPSHVIKAMKPDSTVSRQMIRFSLDAQRSAAVTKSVVAILENDLEHRATNRAMVSSSSRPTAEKLSLTALKTAATVGQARNK